MLVRYLQQHAIEAVIADCGSTMDRLLAAQPFDLVVLDLMLPGEDGREPAIEPESAHEFAKQYQPGIRSQQLVRGFKLEREHRLCQSPHRPVSLSLQIGERLDNGTLSKIKARRGAYGLCVNSIAALGENAYALGQRT